MSGSRHEAEFGQGIEEVTAVPDRPPARQNPDAGRADGSSAPALTSDPEQIGKHMPEMLAKHRNEGIVQCSFDL